MKRGRAEKLRNRNGRGSKWLLVYIIIIIIIKSHLGPRPFLLRDPD